MQLLDIATGPVYAVLGGKFLLIAAAVFGLAWVGIKLVLEIVGRNSASEKEKKDDE